MLLESNSINLYRRIFTVLLSSDSPESAKLWSSLSLMSSGEHLGSIQVRIHIS
jgi:hypothetical protein